MVHLCSAPGVFQSITSSPAPHTPLSVHSPSPLPGTSGTVFPEVPDLCDSRCLRSTPGAGGSTETLQRGPQGARGPRDAVPAPTPSTKPSTAPGNSPGPSCGFRRQQGWPNTPVSRDVSASSAEEASQKPQCYGLSPVFERDAAGAGTDELLGQGGGHKK